VDGAPRPVFADSAEFSVSDLRDTSLTRKSGQ
jgi:hypothetical protein